LARGELIGCFGLTEPDAGSDPGSMRTVARKDGDGFRLSSMGRAFADAGFYRIQRDGEALRVWFIRTLHETFHVYVDAHAVLRCDHEVRFLGFPVLTLHYRISEGP
jgi:hypothetical protein